MINEAPSGTYSMAKKHMGTHSSFRSRFLPAPALLVLMGSALSGQSSQTVTISDTSADLLQLVVLEPGEILNCFQVHFPVAGLYAIVQDVPANGAGFTDKMRALAKNLTNQVVLTPGNYANDQYTAGDSYGVEFDWFTPGDPNQPFRPNLPYPISVYMTPLGGGQAELFSNVFSYTQTDYATRKAAIEAVIGHPMETYTIWLGHSLSSTGGGTLGGITVSGTDNQMTGSIAASSDVSIIGSSNEVSGLVSAARSVDLASSNLVGAVLENAPVPSLPAVLSQSYLRNLAKSYGSYSSGSLTLNNASPATAGVVFAEGDLNVNADGLTGNWAFVSATGDVNLAGNGHQLDSALGSVLVIAYLGNVSIPASNATLMGESHAPGGVIDVNGSGNCLIGPLCASQVVVSGSSNALSDGTVLAP